MCTYLSTVNPPSRDCRVSQQIDGLKFSAGKRIIIIGLRIAILVVDKII